MNPKEIEAFRAVMLSGSMTIAARDIHTTQPNISRLIAHLEYQLEIKLFERAGNKLTPTDEAIAFFTDVERHYVGLKTLKDTAHNIKQFGTGRLRVATAPAISQGFLASVIALFSERYPGVTLAIRTNYSATIEHLIASQVCDIALAVYLGTNIQSAVHAQKIAEMRGVCVLPPGHALAQAKSIKASDLAGENFISLSHQDGLRERIDALFEAKRVPRRTPVETDFQSTICNLVCKGVGVSVVNPIVARDYVPQGIIIKPFSPNVAFPLFMLNPSHRPTGILANAFVDAVHEVLQAEGFLPQRAKRSGGPGS